MAVKKAKGRWIREASCENCGVNNKILRGGGWIVFLGIFISTIGANINSYIGTILLSISAMLAALGVYKIIRSFWFLRLSCSNCRAITYLKFKKNIWDSYSWDTIRVRKRKELSPIVSKMNKLAWSCIGAMLFSGFLSSFLIATIFWFDYFDYAELGNGINHVLAKVLGQITLPFREMFNIGPSGATDSQFFSIFVILFPMFFIVWFWSIYVNFPENQTK